MMSYKNYLSLVLVLIVRNLCFGVGVQDFQSFDDLIEKSDAIAVVRIDKHIEPTVGPNGWTTHNCLVYKTLKGDIPENTRVPLMLLDTTFSIPFKFTIFSNHLVFLKNEPVGVLNIEYRSITMEGTHIEVSPLFNVEVLKDRSIKDDIKLLVEDYVRYRDKHTKRENEFLAKIASDLPKPEIIISEKYPAQQSSQNYVDWISNCMKRIGSVKAGGTRADLLEVFTTEGGLSTRSWRTYVYKECPFIKVDVEFSPVDDGKRKENDADIITKISRPYLQWSVMN